MQAWDVLIRSEGQFRHMVAGNRIISTGIDLPAVLALADALGYDVAAVAELIDACEAGARDGLNRE